MTPSSEPWHSTFVRSPYLFIVIFWLNPQPVSVQALKNHNLQIRKCNVGSKKYFIIFVFVEEGYK